MNQIKISDVFDLEYGNGLSLQNMNPGNIAFIARGSKNNGVSAYVDLVKKEKPFNSGKITVALSGSVLEAFYHDYPFYTAYHVMTLTPKQPMSKINLLIYCSLIKANKFRYSYGRQANRTLANLSIPHPDFVDSIAGQVKIPNPPQKKSINRSNVDLIIGNLIRLDDVFSIEYGNQFDLNKLETTKDKSTGISFVSRTSKNNGVVASVRPYNKIPPFDRGLITVTLGGTYLLSTFIQTRKFYTGQNVKVLSPINEMSIYEKLFYSMIIKSNRFRYTSHGREANKTLDGLLVPDPRTTNINEYMKSLPCSSNLLDND